MKYDFAISYAGEDSEIARKIAHRLQETSRDLSVFFAEENTELLVGVDGEQFFERLFSESKQAIVLISKHYKQKQWSRFEWDVILGRSNENRFIPVRLDDTRLLGLPSSIIYIRFDGANYEEIVSVCIKKLILYEREFGYRRPSEFEKLLDSLKYDSKGATAQAAQLVFDNRTRTPLGDCEIPNENLPVSYEIVEDEWVNFSTIKRLSVNITVPPGLPPDELRFNLKHCAATQFNLHKPDAIMVFAYLDADRDEIGKIPFSAGRAVFAPFGKWEKALDGFAYNISINEFDYAVDFASDYFATRPNST